MNRSRGAIALALGLVLIVLGFSAGTIGAAETTEDVLSTKVSPWALAAVADGAQGDFLVVLQDQADLSPAYDLSTKQERWQWVYQALWETAQRSQAPLRAWLDARGVPYRAFYIVNLIHIEAGDQALVEALAARPDVARIEANPRIQSVEPQPVATDSALAPAAIEWNISLVGAPAVWAMGYTGQGVVVGGQDTGYDWDHPALKNQYRGWNGFTASHDYNWHDAVHTGGGGCGPNSTQPCDDTDHGTHTMGTVLGDDGGANQIGMAPGAQWIGCRDMNQGVGTPATYLECFEFFLAPYPVSGTPAQGNPALAPDVTNNSWGCPASEGCSWNTLQAAVDAQRAAGILTVASAGNDGSSCGSVQDPPPIYDSAYSVGATSSTDNIASFSSRGPVNVDGSGRLKPDISAPGVNIRSSVPGGGYEGGWQGTSMAGPHVAGAVALVWSAQPALRNDLDLTEEVLNTTAVPRYSTQCGDPANTVPNNVYGWGRLNALAAVEEALNLIPPSFTIVKIPSADLVEVGNRLVYTITVNNTGGPATGVVVSDTLPVDTQFAGASGGGVLAGGDVVWTGLSVGANGTLDLTYVVTASCVPSGTHLVNDAYCVHASEWPTPTCGLPVNVTAAATGVMADFTAPAFVLRNQPVALTNHSQNATAYAWAFGDGATSTQANPSHTYTGAAGDYTIVLTASNACTSAVTSQMIAVYDYAVAMMPAAAADAADPGATISYTLRVTNTGTLADDVQLTTNGNQWATQLVPDTLTLGPGDGGLVVARVTVPAGAAGGAHDTAAVTARAS
ncbi:MAG: S8 family serine peptidase, partial [Chloroflexi bacterium]|nr:S8 family serine peptidase [Chloroflexota bacterium]